MAESIQKTNAIALPAALDEGKWPYESEGPKMIVQMVQAAYLRAGGATWPEVGEKLQRSPGTCRAWPQRHPRRWAAMVTDALRMRMPEYELEAVLTSRIDLRSDTDGKVTHNDKKIREIAAEGLRKHARELEGIRLKVEHSGRVDSVMKGTLRMEFARLSDQELLALAQDEEGELVDGQDEEREAEVEEAGTA